MSNQKRTPATASSAAPATRAARAISSLGSLPTEQINPRTRDLDRLSTLAMVRALQREDATVAGAVRRAVPAIARAIDRIQPGFASGGRLIYAGAGTSGRLGTLDASECPPTFGVAPGRVTAIVAGGPRALRRAVEGAEDDAAAAERDLRRLRLRPRDAVVGIAASGRTPYTVGAVRYARQLGCATVGVACVPGSPLAAASEIPIEAVTGPEALAGSTRLKAGTAQKMILNMLSTGLMVRTGRVRGNLLVHMLPTNGKLRQRSERIIAAAAGWSGREAEARARRLLRRHGGDLAAAVAAAVREANEGRGARDKGRGTRDEGREKRYAAAGIRPKLKRS